MALEIRTATGKLAFLRFMRSAAASARLRLHRCRSRHRHPRQARRIWLHAAQRQQPLRSPGHARRAAGWLQSGFGGGSGVHRRSRRIRQGQRNHPARDAAQVEWLRRHDGPPCGVPSPASGTGRLFLAHLPVDEIDVVRRIVPGRFRFALRLIAGSGIRRWWRGRLAGRQILDSPVACPANRLRPRFSCRTIVGLFVAWHCPFPCAPLPALNTARLARWPWPMRAGA